MSSERTNGSRPGGLGPQQIRRLLEKAMRLSRADETEAAFTGAEEALTRFAHNRIHQNVAEVDATLEVRAAYGSRVGTVTTNQLTDDGIARAVQQAGELARHLPENPHWPGLPDPQPLPDVPPAYDEAVAQLCGDPEARARAVADVCAEARAAKLLASGAYSAARSEYAVMNSRGLFAYEASTQLDLTFVCEGPERSASSYAHATGWRRGQIDIEALKRQAIRHALSSAQRTPRHIKPGEYPVVLEPYAVLTLLEAMVEDGMGALAVQEGRSWMNHRFGEACLSPRLTILDDAFDPHGFPRAFDYEGVPKQRVPIVLKGVPTSPVYDRVTAAREPGRASTGHAQPYDDEDWDGPLPENLVVEPGEATVAEMMASLKRGLYVTRFWYVRQTSPHNAAVTGTTRDGMWWIEDGELAYPVRDMRFDQELIPALRDIRGVGRDLHTLSGMCGIHRLPALALEGFRFIEVDGGPEVDG
jgi:predicted Zn-dependent protease